ncbi:hypothetical protein N9937_01840 [bacterium]|nr:hypothetical protein [bacterium]
MNKQNDVFLGDLSLASPQQEFLKKLKKSIVDIDYPGIDGDEIIGLIVLTNDICIPLLEGLTRKQIKAVLYSIYAVSEQITDLLNEFDEEKCNV